MSKKKTYEVLFISESNGSEIKDTSGLDFEQVKLISKYYELSYMGGRLVENFKDLSFIVYKDGIIQAYICCHYMNQKLCDDNTFIQVCYLKEPTKPLIKVILETLLKLGHSYNCQRILINDPVLGEGLSVMGNELYNRNAHHEIQFDMKIDFKDFSEDDFFQNLRKSYKSLVNWGKKNLRTEFLNAENYSYDMFKTIDHLYRNINGKELRPERCLEVQGELVKRGHGELVMCYYKDELIASALFLDEPSNVQYFTGVYNKKYQELGVAHYPVYIGIVRSQERKPKSHCSLGVVRSYIQNPKWRNIQFFKKGFCGNLSPTISWTLPVSLDKTS